MGYAKLIATGNLGRDAEVKFIPSGTAVTEFSIAISLGWGDKKRTEWLECQAWGERFQKLAQYLLKGTSVLIEAEPRTEKWTKDGVEKVRTRWNIREIDLQGGKKDGAHRESTPAAPPADAPPADAPPADGYYGDDIPY